MLKLQYIASASPTCLNLVDVPERPIFENTLSYRWTKIMAAYEEALKLAKEKCIPIEKEDQQDVNYALYKEVTHDPTDKKVPIQWTPDKSKLYDILEGVDFELKHFINCNDCWIEPKSCSIYMTYGCRCQSKQFYILKSKVEEKAKEEKIKVVQEHFKGGHVCHFCLICHTTARGEKCLYPTTPETCKKLALGGGQKIKKETESQKEDALIEFRRDLEYNTEGNIDELMRLIQLKFTIIRK